MSLRAQRFFVRATARRATHMQHQDTRYFSDSGQLPLTPQQVFDAAAEGEFCPRWVPPKYAAVWVSPYRREYRRIRVGRYVDATPAVGCDCLFALDSGLMNLALLDAAYHEALRDDGFCSSWPDFDSGYGYEDTYWDHHDTLEDDERHAAQDKAAQIDAVWHAHDLERAVSAMQAFDAEVAHS